MKLKMELRMEDIELIEFTVEAGDEPEDGVEFEVRTYESAGPYPGVPGELGDEA